MKLKLIIIGIVIVIGIGTFFYVESTQNFAQPIEVKQETQLVVFPQNATSTVVIDKVNLLRPGYIVIHGVDGGRLSQIIEISKYLEVGEHTHVAVNLGESYTPGQDLIAVIYDDVGDKVFNDNAKMSQDSTGNPIAVYVKTGAPVPPAVIKPDPNAITHTAGMDMATVHYTNTGFEPKTLTVPVGTMVEFINDSDIEMWVASNPHPQHDILPTFDEFRTVKKGGVYTYVFDKKGKWAYHDHINSAKEGVIIVK